MRVIFMGSPEFSVPALDALVAAGHDIDAVYCQPPRLAGRGKKPRPTSVQMRADALGLTVRHPENFHDPDEVKSFVALKADVAVVVAYGLILPQVILDAPKNGCLNIHASLLPRWRGAAPIHRAILAGDNQTGVCVMQMEAGLDTGPVLLRQEISIMPGSTTATLHDQLSTIGAEMIVQALLDYESLVAQEQSAEGVTYAAKIAKAEARIDWDQPAEIVDRQIRGLLPFPGAWTELKGERLKLLDSGLTAAEGTPGEVLDHGLTIACGSGSIRTTKIQRAGKSPMDIADLLRGFDMPVGSHFT